MVRISLLFTNLCLLCGSLLAQSHELDSLKKLLRSNPPVAQKARLHNQVSWLYYKAESDSARYYARKALYFSMQAQQREAIVTAHLQLAEVHRTEQEPESAASQLALAEQLIRPGSRSINSLRLLLFKGNLAMSTTGPGEALRYYQKGYARTLKNDPLRAEFCLNLARLEQGTAHPQKEAVYLKEALWSAQLSHNHSAAMIAANNLGNCYARQQQYATARQFYEKSLYLAMQYKDLPGQSRAYLNTGNLSYYEGRWTIAIDYYIKSAHLKERLHDGAGIALIHNNIAAIYKEQHRYAESLHYFLKSSRYYEQAGDSIMLAESWVNTAIVKIVMGKPQAGLHLLKQSLVLLKGRNEPATLLIAHINIAFAYSEMGRHHMALTELAISERAAIAQEDEHSMAFIRNLYGASYFFLGDYPKAKDQYAESYALATKLGLLNEQQKALFGLYETAEKTGDYARALDWFEIYNRVEDSLFNTETTSRLAELQEQYDSGQKGQEIRSLNAENKAISLKNKLTGNQLKLSLLTVAIVLLIIALLSLFFYQRNKRQRSVLAHTRELNKERINQLISQQEILTLETAVVAQQAERRKLAKDIHDNIGSFLATLKYQHEAARPDSSEPVVQHNYNTTSELIAAACTEVRAVSHQMATGEGFDFHLLPAIRQLVGRINSTGQLVVEFHHLAEAFTLPRESELILYKIVQELLSNVLKHARATLVTLQINQSDDDLTLMIEDNGCGFDTATGNAGIGLANIRERVAQLSGTLELNSRIHHGTTIVVALPIFHYTDYD